MLPFRGGESAIMDPLMLQMCLVFVVDQKTAPWSETHLIGTVNWRLVLGITTEI